MLQEHDVINSWRDDLSDNRTLVRALMHSEQTEHLLDHLQKHLASVADFRILLLPVEAALPRPDPPEPKEKAEAPKAKWIPRISREELYGDINRTARLDWVFVLMVVLSTIVAAIGLMRDNVAIIIGAMVIAPLLGPNVAFCLATTLGDIPLGVRAVKANAVGLLIAFSMSIAMGYLLDVNTSSHEIASRTEVGIGDIVLGLAAGAAAAMAFTTGLSASLIGVMVAVALLPPLVTVGLLSGSGEFYRASEALLLLITNVICVSLAGVTTFFAQGIQPRSWYAADKAKRATRIAIALWTILLLVLVGVILLTQSR